ncbi:MAG: hypothetical protein D6780_03560 [Candidatus Dadabacteria bacterium]|nr:MAG: hypothetical protein D6780_03560 [Candidatus Dadabacteria bacterium]
MFQGRPLGNVSKTNVTSAGQVQSSLEQANLPSLTDSALLIQETVPEGALLSQHNVHLGLGFDTKTQRVPIDVLTLLLSARKAKSFTVLVVDEFQKINNENPLDIAVSLDRTMNFLQWAKQCYGLNFHTLLASSFMHSSEYQRILNEVKERAKGGGEVLLEKLRKTAPNRNRQDTVVNYALNEIAVTKFLQGALDTSLKIGPSREKLYDELMPFFGINLAFAYVIDAFPAGTGKREAQPVVHYIGHHKGTQNGQRIFISDHPANAKAKVYSSGEAALKYFAKLGASALEALNKRQLAFEVLEQVVFKKQIKTSRGIKNLVFNALVEGIFKPYQFSH